MNAPKFTPGPWYVKQGVSQMVSDDTTVVDVSRARNALVHWFVFSPAEDHGDQKADADLIAAAPSLYEALAGLLSIFDSVTMGQEAERRDEWLPKARAALAKAVQP